MADSIRERVVLAIQARLATLSWVNKIPRVEHRWDGEIVEVETLGDPPFIAITEVSEDGDVSEVSAFWQKILTLQLDLVLAGGVQDASTLNGYQRDIEAALFAPPYDGLGLGAFINRITRADRDFETGEALSGIRLILSVSYRHLYSDPTSIGA